MDIEEITNSIKTIEKERELIFNILNSNFPQNTIVSYMNEKNIEISASVIRVFITDTNIPKLEVKTLVNNKVKIITLESILSQTITNSFKELQISIKALQERFGLIYESHTNEKRIEIFQKILEKVGIDSLFVDKKKWIVSEDKLINLLLNEDTIFSRFIEKLKIDRFLKFADVLTLNSDEFIIKHKVSDSYQKAAINEIKKNIWKSIVFSKVKLIEGQRKFGGGDW
ncbi:hypothetical protein ACOL3H_07090 [Aliarcobacter butzleri]